MHSERIIFGALHLQQVALQVLEELLCEHDEAPHAWYLLALAYYGGGCFDEASETLEHATKLLAKLNPGPQRDASALYGELQERIKEAQCAEGP
jgi:tetratricopeptide (TPR) repeat protein